MAGSIALLTEAQTRKGLTNPIISEALKEAINDLSSGLIRDELKRLCDEFPIIIRSLEDRLLVRGKDVVRYHEDNSSDLENEIESEDSDGEKEKPIALRDEEYTPRMAKCENCNREFDITSNSQGDCVWHPDLKIVDGESEFWADHDEDCHGRFETFEDDPDYADGFIWECCNNPGDHKGCRETMHRTKVNLVVTDSLPVPTQSKKRGAEEESSGTDAKRGRRW